MSQGGGNASRTTSAERMRLSRQRRRQGKRAIRLPVNEDEVDFLPARGYPLKRTDNRSRRPVVGQTMEPV